MSAKVRELPSDTLLRNPITGIAGCCARAASGHAAAPPSSPMNVRRFKSSMEIPLLHAGSTTGLGADSQRGGEFTAVCSRS